MSTASLVERQTRLVAQARTFIPAWETAFACAILFLSTNAVVPLVFNPQLGGTGRTVSIRDPLSQPAWLLASLFIILMLFRFGGEVFVALVRNPGIGTICLLALLSTFWSAVPQLTLQSAIELALSTLFGLYVGVRFGIDRLVKMLGWITVAILAVSVVFALALPKYGIDHVRGNAWRGVFGTKNELGRMMVVGGVVWAVRVFAGEVGRIRGTALVVAFALVGIASGARTALGVTGLLAGVFVLLMMLSRENKVWVPIKGLVVAGLGLSALVLITNVSVLLKVVGADYSLTGRTSIWSPVWSAIRDHPWLGYGFDAFWRGIYGPSLEVWRFSHNTPPHSHNGFLDLLLSLGVTGLAIFVVAFAVTWRRGLAELHRGEGSSRTFPLIFLSLLMLYNLTESGLIATRSFEWIVFVAVAAALSRLPTMNSAWGGGYQMPLLLADGAKP
jgi:exopolysaccharide production protein ExoQ